MAIAPLTFLFRLWILAGGEGEAVDQIVREGGNAIFLAADVGCESSVHGLFRDGSQWQGHLDILVCNARVTSSETIFTTSLSEWECVLKTNLIGAFLCAKYGMHLTRSQTSGGRLIFSALALRIRVHC
jgi:NAD(P)-dependent dehydrogenase (short-subunit alcohol dehydrogenase family)